MQSTRAVQYETEIPNILKAMIGVETAIGAEGVNAGLHHLLKLRASQINQCAFCVKMHTREAREHGETNDRLDRVIVWRHVRDFTDAEKSALAWTEALTVLDPRDDLGALRAALRTHYSEHEIAVMTAVVTMINLWNRLQGSRH